MIEKIYKLSQSEEKLIERVIADENIHLNHMSLNKNEGLPVHTTNATVYMIVVRGTVNLSLAGEEAKNYEKDSIINIPFGIEMDAKNLNDEKLELIVVKAPAPSN